MNKPTLAAIIQLFRRGFFARKTAKTKDKPVRLAKKYFPRRRGSGTSH